MSKLFDLDPYPGKTKILFIGYPESSHTHSWIDLMKGTQVNIRLFGLPSSIPPADWPVKTYLSVYMPKGSNPSIRRQVYPPRGIIGPTVRAYNFFSERYLSKYKLPRLMSIEKKLAQVLNDWQPDIVHTLGFDPAGYFYQSVTSAYPMRKPRIWVAQVRGGPELVLYPSIPENKSRIEKILQQCDYLIADNQENYDIAVSFGLEKRKISPLGIVPGTGGIDVSGLSNRWHQKPSYRDRIIVWPKTYEAPSSKALPVLEAIKIAWEHIQPCKIYMLWTIQPELKMWLPKLPPSILESCIICDRIPRQEVLDLMLKARVMLAPSLTDGVPNAMLEAMACGAFPIVSPLSTITPAVKQPDHVLFARNLYPEEIASALITAMKDDALVDQAAERNLIRVRELADRERIGPEVQEFYSRLVSPTN